MNDKLRVVPSYVLGIALVSGLVSCGAPTARTPRSHMEVREDGGLPLSDTSAVDLTPELLMNKVKIGMQREEVEGLLGPPMQTTESIDATTSTYILGMPSMPAMNPGMGGGILSGALSMAGSLAGLAGPAGGIVGGSVAQLGSSLIEQQAISEMPDMTRIRMLTVSYREGKVATIQKMNPGMMMGEGEHAW